MKRPDRKAIWPWILIGLASVIVITFLSFFVWRMMHPPIEPFVDEDGPPVVIQVDVVNASGVNGAGRVVMDFLRERGFDVVELATDPSVKRSSFVVDRMGDRISALKIARVLGIADTVVISEIDSMRFVRASVILGKDLRSLEPFRD